MASNVEVRCPKCSKTFDSRPAMEAHQRDKHLSRRSLSSPGTQPSTGSSTVYQSEVDSSLCESPIKSMCRCGKQFQNEKHLQQHILDKRSKRFGCDQCCKSFDSKDDLEDHQKKKHRTVEKPNKPPQTGLGLQTAAVTEDILCLSDHLKNIYSKQTIAPFKCPCGKEYQELVSFEQHLTDKQNTAKPHKCNVCCETYNSEKAVEDHCKVKHEGRRDISAHDQLKSSVTDERNILARTTARTTSSPGVETEVFKCSCGKVFSNEGELKQHAQSKKANSKPFPCTCCCESFDCGEDMKSHVKNKHNDLNKLAESFRNMKVETNTVYSNVGSGEGGRLEGKSWSCACGRIFDKEDQLTQHRVAKKEKAKPFPCPQCCHSYESPERLDAHMSSQHAGIYPNDGTIVQLQRTISSSSSSAGVQPMFPVIGKTFRCLQCIRQFSSFDALIAHEKEKGHDNSDVRGNKLKSMQRYLENYYRIKSDVKPEDKSASFEFVRSKILQILSDVRKQEGGEIFKCELRNAGSNANELKIGKADEFDFNIPVEVKVLEVKRTGTVPYIFKDKEKQKEEGPSSKNMNVKRELKYEPGGKYPIPKDYAVLVVDIGASPTLSDLCVSDHLIAHHLQQRLYSCIRKAITGMKGIDLNAEAHGPAITMNMHPPGGHQISVDLTMVIDCKDITVKEYNWPRPDTHKHLSRKVIEAIVGAGCQLTPKGDEFWNISFSNCESFLMKEIDGPNECRKMCHKLLKTFFQTWKSRSKTGYKTITSFIFKHLTFWMNERKLEPGYWNQYNLSICFLDTLKELLKSLDSKKLINYFIPCENILGIRDLSEMNELTEEVKKEIRELENINC
ncbi:hypothetical protein ACJMK2_021559 [Sinanodonta woodiana]|uniref:C2H2-type domain-containing protein n=1 Tax=Sinanodonta woodiana TaxID=1069815 RepID=A0ABD3TGF6_SINWO